MSVQTTPDRSSISKSQIHLASNAAGQGLNAVCNHQVGDNGYHPDARSPLRGAGSSSLGIQAQSSSEGENPVDAAIRARYRLQRKAQQLMEKTESGKAFCRCQRDALPVATYVTVRLDPDQGTSHFHGLISCDSYACPICAMRRSEEDRHALSVALAQALKMGYFPLLITCTVRHNRQDKVKALRSGLHEAFDSTFSGRWYDDLTDEYGIVGKLKSWETTRGKSGWHPHLHVLMFMKLELAGHWLQAFTNRLRERWIAKLEARGFDASWEHGLDVRTADSDIAEYIAKFGREPRDRTWGADAEIAKSPVKRARFEGLTPFDLLAAADGDSEALERLAAAEGFNNRARLMVHAGSLYREYFEAFKGKPRIYWGKLKRVLELDEALADFADENQETRTLIDMVLIERTEFWKLHSFPVVDAVTGELTRVDLRSELRALVRTGDAFKVLIWLVDHRIRGEVPPAALAWSAAQIKLQQQELPGMERVTFEYA